MIHNLKLLDSDVLYSYYKPTVKGTDAPKKSKFVTEKYKQLSNMIENLNKNTITLENYISSVSHLIGFSYIITEN